MAWRSVVISKPARLSLKQGALLVEQTQGSASVPLEDIASLVLDNPQITLTTPLLSACAEQQVVVITVNDSHIPNGVFLAHTPHSRAVKVMRQQLEMTQPHKKRLWQLIVQQKIRNQAQLLAQHGQVEYADRLLALAERTKSGDGDNCEAIAAQAYFPALFEPAFTRDAPVFANSALNYGYAIVRAAIARSLVSFGFLPAFGLHHRSELNAFNLADDLIEPYRVFIDAKVKQLTIHYDDSYALTTELKASLVNVLHCDAIRLDNNMDMGKSTLLALIDASVISLGQSIQTGNLSLLLPNYQYE